MSSTKGNGSKRQQSPEKSDFTRRCSLLSRYLKEKGSFGNINLSFDQPETMQKKASEPSDSTRGRVDFSESQLTIFFGGEVLVYNEFPEDKAKEIMEVAKQYKTLTEIKIHQTQVNVENNKNSNLVLPDLNEPTDSADTKEQEKQQQQQQHQIVERIARRASLHRFFAKRKDRAVARAPYQVNQIASNHRYPPKPETVAYQPLEPGQSSQTPDKAIAQTMSNPKSDGDKHVTMEIEESQSLKDLDLRL